ncbi:MAG: hypothetical protein KDK39_02135 [Leptospiraceae bacterium]|nr:hypothetical protein [Leptospiraceae bacterium]
MLINREQEAQLHDLIDAGIGLAAVSRAWLGWQAARLLIRWNALVIRGEDDTSPAGLFLKKRLDDWLAGPHSS